jgi:hypothetical protein
LIKLAKRLLKRRGEKVDARRAANE